MAVCMAVWDLVPSPNKKETHRIHKNKRRRRRKKPYMANPMAQLYLSQLPQLQLQKNYYQELLGINNELLALHQLDESENQVANPSFHLFPFLK